MSHRLIYGLAAAALLLGRSPASGQQSARHQSVFADQLHAEAVSQLAGSTVSNNHVRRSFMSPGSHGHAALIGGVIGAVALPGAAFLLAATDRDNTGPNSGGVLILGAIGAFVGAIFGLAIHGG